MPFKAKSAVAKHWKVMLCPIENPAEVKNDKYRKTHEAPNKNPRSLG